MLTRPNSPQKRSLGRFSTLTSDASLQPLPDQPRQYQPPSSTRTHRETEPREQVVSNNPAHLSDDEQMSLISQSCDENEDPSVQYTAIPQSLTATSEQSQRVPDGLKGVPSTSPNAAKGKSNKLDTPDIPKPLWRIWAIELACLLLSVLLFICTSMLQSTCQPQPY